MGSEIRVREEQSAIAPQGELSVGDLIAQVTKVRTVMDTVMRKDTHYGLIPGCGDKPTLFKAGAEKLALVFRLAPAFDVRKTELPNWHREYEVVCTLTHIPTGATIAQGIGVCSTMESKYRYRGGSRKCPACGKAAIKVSKYPPRGAPRDTPQGFYCYAKIGGGAVSSSPTTIRRSRASPRAAWRIPTSRTSTTRSSRWRRSGPRWTRR